MNLIIAKIMNKYVNQTDLIIDLIILYYVTWNKIYDNLLSLYARIISSPFEDQVYQAVKISNQILIK